VPLVRMAAIALLFALSLSAETVIFLGVSNPNSGVVASVGAYDLDVDGHFVEGYCVSPFAPFGLIWTASFVPVIDFTDPRYIQATWLATQAGIQPSATISIQDAIWDLFGANYQDPETLAWLSAPWTNAYAANYGVLVADPAGISQDFLVDYHPATNGTAPTGVPESASVALAGIGLVLFGTIRMLRRTA